MEKQKHVIHRITCVKPHLEIPIPSPSQRAGEGGGTSILYYLVLLWTNTLDSISKTFRSPPLSHTVFKLVFLSSDHLSRKIIVSGYFTAIIPSKNLPRIIHILPTPSSYSLRCGWHALSNTQPYQVSIDVTQYCVKNLVLPGPPYNNTPQTSYSQQKWRLPPHYLFLTSQLYPVCWPSFLLLNSLRFFPGVRWSISWFKCQNFSCEYFCAKPIYTRIYYEMLCCFRFGNPK